MTQEFEELIELLVPLVTKLLQEQESDRYSNNLLDLSVIPSIACSGGKHDRNA